MLGTPLSLKKKRPSISFKFFPILSTFLHRASSVLTLLTLIHSTSFIYILSPCIFCLYDFHMLAIMNGFDHMTMHYLPPHTNTATDDYLTTLPAMGGAEHTFRTPNYSTDNFRR